MGKNNNFGKAAYEMFGIGRGDEEGKKPAAAPEDAVAEPAASDTSRKEAPELQTADEVVEALVQEREAARTAGTSPRTSKYQTTVLAEGSVFEGTLRAKGSVDLACEFKGNIFAEGDVVMRTSLEGNVEGDCVELISCTVQGDIMAKSKIKVHQGSSIRGNIKTRDLSCSGRVDGDIAASGHVVLESSARLSGNLTAATLTIEEGAAIEGNLKVARSRANGGK